MKAKSTGMGLYLVKKIGDRLGLKIEIDSKAGEYTMMRLIYPKTNYNKMD